MNLVVDTSVWSAVLRRRPIRDDDPFVRALRSHIEHGDGVFLVGVILQELLTGLRRQADFDRLLTFLSAVPLIAVDRGVFILAAQVSNRCRQHGLQAAAVDCLIAAACVQYGYPLLTADHHFLQISQHNALVVLPPLGS